MAKERIVGKMMVCSKIMIKNILFMFLKNIKRIICT